MAVHGTMDSLSFGILGGGDAALDGDAFIGPTRGRAVPHHGDRRAGEADVERVACCAGDRLLAALHDAGRRYPLDVLVCAVGLAVLAHMHALELARCPRAARRLRRRRLREAGSSGTEVQLQARPLLLTGGLVVRTHAGAVKVGRAHPRPLVVPDAHVHLRGLHIRQARGGKGCAAAPLVEERVEEALPALRADEFALDRQEAALPPSGAGVEGEVGGEELDGTQHALVRTRRKKAQVQRRAHDPAGAEEAPRGRALHHRRDITLELNVLVIVGHGVVLLQAQDVQPHEVHGAAPSLRRIRRPLLGVPLEGGGQGPGHLHEPDTVFRHERPLLAAQLLHVLLQHDEDDVAGSACLLGQDLRLRP
mmetsp:Transcript_59317/g.164026  ORF Transcript_59317/g.164026 Transcript_59317/m.164026 type:complete len:364 (+) Transcript_59317:127-1218(+)